MASATAAPGVDAAAPPTQAQETPTPTPTDEPQPSDSPPPPESPTPSPTCTIVCPPITPAPTPSRTRQPTAPPTEDPAPSESDDPGDRTPDPLLTAGERESPRPDPVLPTVSVSPVPVSQLSFDASASVEASAAAEATGAKKGRSVGSIFALAGLVVVVLGGAGVTGLYLTRDPGGHE